MTWSQLGSALARTTRLAPLDRVLGTIREFAGNVRMSYYMLQEANVEKFRMHRSMSVLR